MQPSGRTLSVVNVDGGPTSSSCCSYEADIDVEQAGAVAPDANVVVYQAPNSDYGYADALFQAASDNLASSVSMNWGASETALEAVVLVGQASPAFAAAIAEAYMEMAVQGQSAFVPSGDGGAYQAWQDLGTTYLSVGYNSSPFVTVAGGTTLPTTYELSNTIGTQTLTATVNPTPTVSHSFGSGRATPNLSADADPWTGYLLYCPSCGSPPLEGLWGGTSFVRANPGGRP